MAIPVLVAAVLLTAVTLVLIFAELSRSARTALLAVDATLWLFFAVDYVVRLVLTPTKRKFLRTEWLDLVLVVLPFLVQNPPPFLWARLAGKTLQLQLGGFQLALEGVDLQLGEDLSLSYEIVSLIEHGANPSAVSEEEVFLHHRCDTPAELELVHDFTAFHSVRRFDRHNCSGNRGWCCVAVRRTVQVRSG